MLLKLRSILARILVRNISENATKKYSELFDIRFEKSPLKIDLKSLVRPQVGQLIP